MEESANLTLTRRRQRRPDLQTECPLPPHLAQLVESVEIALKSSMDVADGKPDDVLKAMKATCSALQTLRTVATTPELQLRAVSKVTSSIRECRLGHPEKQSESESLTSSERAFMDTLILRFVFSLLLDCRVRYLHKALTTLFRTTYVITSKTLDAFESIFLESLQRWCAPVAHASPSASTGTDGHLFVSAMRSGTLTEASPLAESKEGVMYFLNSLDGLSSTLMPMMPSVFLQTFLSVLPLLGECLQWAVEQALSNSQSKQANTQAEGEGETAVPNERTTAPTSVAPTSTVFGEDLDHVRFCARVVATYIHKYMNRLTVVLQQPRSAQDSEQLEQIRRNMARLLWPAMLMFSSEVFPKDVLNAAGLLLASLLTVRTCDTAMLVAVCRTVCEERLPGDTTERDGATPQLLALAEAAAAELCTAGVDGRVTFPAVSTLCTRMTKNARFAVLKGLLAHLSAPIHGSWKSLSALLLPFSSLTSEPATCVPLYDTILPYAESYANALSEPETRFMAIQCMDSVVRHLVAVMAACQSALVADREGDADEGSTPASKRPRKESDRGDLHASNPRATPVQDDTNAVIVRKLLPACLPSQAMLNALGAVTQLAMGLWDDGTQQMSGTLYGTYDEVLRAQKMANWFQRTLSSPLAKAAARPHRIVPADDTALMVLAQQAGCFTNSLDLVQALRDVLSIQNERRGKYHALLGLMGVLPADVFLHALESCGEAGLSSFAVMLLGGATNHKIGNVCGEVFCQTVGLVQKQQKVTSSTSEGDDDLLAASFLRPLAKSIVVEGYVRVASNVDTSTAISNIIAHFVTPLLRQDAKLLPQLLEMLKTTSASTHCRRDGSDAADLSPRAIQGVVDIIARARSVGIDVTQYLTPGHHMFTLLQHTTQAFSFELRNAALNLLVVSTKKAEPVLAWQCALIESFVSLNLQLGGDNTARKMLFETLRKWTRRLTDTFGTAEKETVSPYQTLLLTHGQQLCEVLAAHVGTPDAPLAVERRVAAMCVYKMLLSTLLGVLGATHKVTNSPFLCKFFIPSAVPMLVMDLSDGWEQARILARELLDLFATYTPASVFDSCASTKALLAEDAAYADLSRARTYRNAEGAVQRLALSALHRPETVQAWRGQHGASVASLCARLARETAVIATTCTTIDELTGHAALEFIVDTPLHGHLSLCLELVGSLLSRTTGADAATVSGPCNTLLRTAHQVLSVCSGLVGADSEGDGGEVVDCRGHVFTKGDPGAEAVMRRVVNNTWLSVRVATALVTRVLCGVKAEQLSFDAVRGACFALVNVLLRTKHNGVMRCARGALKSTLEMLIRSRSEALHAIPHDMLSHLLGEEGVTSSDVGRMLRRSQGLPHAILAVLEAEDSSMPNSLFPTAMSTLMRVAKSMHAASVTPPTNAGQGAAPRPEAVSDEASRQHKPLPGLGLSHCSNALNVLKFVFEDRALADRAVAYLEEAFTTATSGFNHDSWYIRNSCLMLFASVLQRLVGEHPSLGGAGVNTSVHDLQKRTPDGVVFALETLHTARHSETQALFPILQMLSMLSPDPPQLWRHRDHEGSAGEGDSVDGTMAAMVNAVAQCGSSANLMVRSASAVALGCVVPVDAIQTVMLGVSQSFYATSGGDRCSLNALHGALLQLHQFHRQYVGTTHHTSRRRHLSGYATPAVRHTVSLTAAQCLLQSSETTLRRLSQCATTAASFLSLLSDVLVFGHANGIPLETEAALIQIVHPFLTTGFASPPSMMNVTDRGALHAHAASALLATIASVAREENPCTVSTAPLQEVMTLWGTVLASEHKKLLGAHNVDQHQDLVTALIAAYLDTAATPVHLEIDLFVSAMQRHTGFDVCEASLQALKQTLEPHVCTPRESTNSNEHWLGCLASAACATHTRFALALCQGRDPLGSRCLHQPALRDVVTAFRALLAVPPGSSSPEAEAGTGASPRFALALETEAPAIELVMFCTTRSGALGGGAGVDAELLRLLSYYSDPDQAEALRRVAVESLRLCLKAVAAAVPGRQLVPLDVKASLLCVLLRLLCDDASSIRDAACQVCSEAAKNSGGVCRDQFTCVLSVVKALRHCTHEMKPSTLRMQSLCRTYLLGETEEEDTADATPPPARGETDKISDQSDDDSELADAEEVLFEREADNMFAERGLMLFFASRILPDSANEEWRAHVPFFPLFDRLLDADIVQTPQDVITLSLLSFP